MKIDDTSITTDAKSAVRDAPSRPRRPGQSLACGWCGSLILLPARGRVPKWCSSSCRHRAWELTRAAASGRAAVQVVDRVVEVDRPVTVVQEVPVPPSPKGRRGLRCWPSSPPSSTPGGYMTATFPPWPRDFRTSSTHSTVGPDGDGDHVDHPPIRSTGDGLSRPAETPYR